MTEPELFTADPSARCDHGLAQAAALPGFGKR